MRKPDNKPIKRKIYHSYESLMLQKSKNQKTMQERLDEAGYRRVEEYRDCVSHYAW